MALALLSGASCDGYLSRGATKSCLVSVVAFFGSEVVRVFLMSGSWRDVIASLRTFRVSWAQVRLAIQTSTAAICSYALATSLALPQSYWAVFTGILVVQASVGASLAAATDRLLATILGGAVGAVLIALFG